MLATLIGNRLTREPTSRPVLTKCWNWELILSTNFGRLCQTVTKFGSQNFGYQIWFCTKLLSVDNCSLAVSKFNYIHGYCSIVKITFAPICTCKNNQRIGHCNTSTPRSMTSQINCCDITMLSQKRPSLATMVKLMIAFSGIVCSGHKIACKKYNDTFLTVHNDFWVTHEAISQWFSSLVKTIGKSPHSWPKNLY